jgi:hypothetical protein
MLDGVTIARLSAKHQGIAESAESRHLTPSAFFPSGLAGR